MAQFTTLLRPWASVALPLAALIVLGVQLQAQAAFPGENGRLAFAVPSGGYDIVTVKRNGKDVRNLTEGARGASRDPSYSADGKRIVFVSSRDGGPDIYLMDANGGSVTRVTAQFDDAANPGFTPDGDSIVFEADGKVRSVDVDGSNMNALVKGGQPALSPDGKTLAFVRESHGDEDIFVASPSGAHAENLTRDFRTKKKDVGFLAPSFSPDGRDIVFNSNLSRRFPDRPFQDDLYAMTANGKRLERLTRSKQDEFGATFSPDGNEIAFVRDTERGARKDGIYVMSSGVERVLRVSRPGTPTWQPLP